ncbi:MAG: rod shape-determining protein MreC [Epulopiscium sp.]|nr:rod shape-determining protein MreC [Candidatus Epulonipiscium sp.]
MGFFEEYKKQIIMIIAGIFILTALFTAGRKMDASFVDNAFGFVVTPLQEATSGVGKWVQKKVSSAQNKTNLEKENEELKKQIAQLEATVKRLSMYEEENKKLSELLKITPKFPQYTMSGAEIIAKDPGNWYNIFIINKGKKQGLAANMVITAPGGLVGKIVECGNGYAKVQSLLDSRSSISAMSLRTGDLGVVKGDYSLMDSGLCRMEYIDAQAEMMVGDEIVTSHLSTLYPPGISIGKIKEIKTESNGLTKYAIIEPYVDFKHLETILVIQERFDQKNNSEAEN